MPDRTAGPAPGQAGGSGGGSGSGSGGSGSGEPIRLAREALAAAKADARAKGLRPVPAPRRPADEADAAASGGRVAGLHGAPGQADSSPPGSEAEPGPSPSVTVQSGMANAGLASRAPVRRPRGRRQRRDDPQPLAAAIGGLLEAEGWALAAATGSVFGRWAQIVGPELASHTAPETLADGELTVSADSTAWATQLRLLAGQLVRRLNSELGDGTVVRVKVRGPVTSTRKPGEWRVRGSRGPRDTYG
jgi:predicted nucleic acid-binding Zn ribbon protein